MEEGIIKMYIENGILFGMPQGAFIMDLKTVKNFIDRRQELTLGKPYPVFVDCSNMSALTKEAREYIASRGGKGITAIAFITTTLASRIWINLFMSLYLPPQPVKMFTNKEKALIWLKQFAK
jgi:hypothetical protein